MPFKNWAAYEGFEEVSYVQMLKNPTMVVYRQCEDDEEPKQLLSRKALYNALSERLTKQQLSKYERLIGWNTLVNESLLPDVYPLMQDMNVWKLVCSHRPS